MCAETHSKRVAKLRDATVLAVVDNLFRFKTETQAISRIRHIARNYAACTYVDCLESDDSLTLKLWIQDFALTQNERLAGYRGNFAKISMYKLDDGKITLKAEKIVSELRTHPQKNYACYRHPNYGHPILRQLNKGKLYLSIEDARAELLRLHEMFPEASIPGRDRLYLMVYHRGGKPPVKKVILNIVPVRDEGVRLIMVDNLKTPKIVTSIKSLRLKDSDSKFSSMVALQRKRAKKN